MAKDREIKQFRNELKNFISQGNEGIEKNVAVKQMKQNTGMMKGMVNASRKSVEKISRHSINVVRSVGTNVRTQVDEVLGEFSPILDVFNSSVSRIGDIFKSFLGFGEDKEESKQTEYLKKLYRFQIKKDIRDRKAGMRDRITKMKKGKWGLIVAGMLLLGGIITGFITQGIDIFKKLTKSLFQIDKWGKSFVSGFTRLFAGILKKFPSVEGKIMKLGSFISRVGKFFTKVGSAVGKTIKTLNKFGIFRLGKVIGRIAYPLFLAWDLYKGFTEAGEGVANKIKGLAAGLTKFLLDIPVILYNLIAPLFGLKKIDLNVKKIIGWIDSLTEWTKVHITFPIYDFIQAFKNTLSSFKANVISVKDRVVSIINTAREWISENIENPIVALVNKVKEVFAFFFNKIGSIVESVLNPKKIMSGMVDGLKGSLSKGKDYLLNKLFPKKDMSYDALREKVKDEGLDSLTGKERESYEKHIQEQARNIRQEKADKGSMVEDRYDEAREKKKAEKMKSLENQEQMRKSNVEITGLLKNGNESRDKANVAITNAVSTQSQSIDKGTDIENDDDSLLSLLTFGILQ